MPYIESLYNTYGKNQAGLIVLSVYITGETDAQVMQQVNNYKIPYPSISSTGGGKTISSAYNPGYTPQLILIAPDKKIVEKDLNYKQLIPSLQKYNISTSIQYDPDHNSNPAAAAVIGKSTDRIIFSISKAGFYNIQSYALTGGKMDLKFEKFFSPGIHSLYIDFRAFSKGVAIIEIESSYGKSGQRLLF